VGPSRPRRLRRLVAAFGGVALVLAVLGVALARGGPTASSPLVGATAPDFRLTSLDGTSIALSEERGSPVVVSFWASWCEPCDREVPLLARAADDHAADGLVVLGIVFADDADSARAFLRSHGARYPALLDPDTATAVAFGVYGIPETFFVDRDGRIAARRIGELTWPDLEADVASLLR
jgi:cytochrome c biogenesis protein CcmG/thiol:disulfide interchange protein DsbE